MPNDTMHKINVIQNGNIRTVACERDGKYYLEFDCNINSSWVTVLATGLVTTPNVYTSKKSLICEDPILEWKWNLTEASLQENEAIFSKSLIDSKHKNLTLQGKIGCHDIREKIVLKENRFHITVIDSLTTSSEEIRLGRLMSQFYFVPEKKASRSTEPLDFAWIPAIHKRDKHVCADHFFRSPTVIVQSNGYYAALVPDLKLFKENRNIQHALDLRITETRIEAPRLSYGICPSVMDDHLYFKHDSKHTEIIKGDRLSYGFDLFFGKAENYQEITGMITSYLWKIYGHKTFQDPLPQVLPFEEYGRCYTYRYELPKSVRKTTIKGKSCFGIHNPYRRGANFHAWENDLHVGYGIWHYADKWGDKKLRNIAEGIMQLILCAPRKKGAFPCIYNYDKNTYEGSLFWTARCADPLNGYDTAAMSTTAWWQLYWYEDLTKDSDVLDSVISYASFLEKMQLNSGAIPTYFFSDLKPAKQLLESATTAISGAVLAKAAILTNNLDFRRAAVSTGCFIEKNIIPGLFFNDFETYYSCSDKPLHAIDYWTGIRPHNNLSIQWACDQFLSLYKLTGEEVWLHKGEYLLSILSLYQQVWNPSHLNGNLFGGFGVMNTDGEWNDGRQARFVSTYSDYYQITGKTEYLERAVAACRASFALMDIQENHANEINKIIMRKDQGEAGLGYAPENIYHSGFPTGSWTGMNWSSGGGLAASAFLERRFGGVWIDGETQEAIPIDGAESSIKMDDSQIKLSLSSALNKLKFPYSKHRDVKIKFGRLKKINYEISLNNKKPKKISFQKLKQGIIVRI
jgi:hypothetical protein